MVSWLSQMQWEPKNHREGVPLSKSLGRSIKVPL